MTTLHMKIEEVRNAAQQVDLAVGELYLKPRRLKSAASSLRSAWQGGKSSYYASQLAQMGSVLQNEVVNLQRLVKQVRSEVDEWEDEDASFGFTLGSLGSFVSTGLGVTNSGKDEPKTMKDLAILTMTSLYEMDDKGDYNPIRIVRIGTNEYLVLLAGTIGGLLGPSWNSAQRSAADLSNDYNKQVKSIINDNLPQGAIINFAGHSQGGLVANQLANDPNLRVNSVTTFGSGINAVPNPNVTYNRYVAEGDIAPFLSTPPSTLVKAAAIDILAGRNPFENANLKQNEISGQRGFFNFGDDHSIYKESSELENIKIGSEVSTSDIKISMWEDVGTYNAGKASSISVAPVVGPFINAYDGYRAIEDTIKKL